MATLAVKTAVGPTILLQSGAYFDLLDPKSSNFTIEDVAHGLSMTCRFAGQCRQFYSVAEHCWHASFLVPDELQRAALLHDAAEAFIGDVTRPLKTLLPEYKVIEKRIEAAIVDRFGIDGWDDPRIKHADQVMLHAEQAEMMPAHEDSWATSAGLGEPYPIAFEYRPPRLGRSMFLSRYYELAVEI